ncbi:hypothetical protein ABI59_18650 [Acidobacteria bacterium Mor1]|nr:hypothetical protein ABI59_18650 [Acidobacteria bacterium Mor1]
MRKSGIALIALALTAALVVPAVAGAGHGKSKCGAGAEDCMNKMASKLRAQGWVGIEADHGEDGKVTIMSVVADSPAARAGIREGDVLVAMNGIKLAQENYPKIKAMRAELSVGSDIQYTIVRSGQKQKMKMVLAEIPDTVLASWIGKHMVQDHITIAANY